MGWGLHALPRLLAAGGNCATAEALADGMGLSCNTLMACGRLSTADTSHWAVTVIGREILGIYLAGGAGYLP